MACRFRNAAPVRPRGCRRCADSRSARGRQHHDARLRDRLRGFDIGCGVRGRVRHSGTPRSDRRGHARRSETRWTGSKPGARYADRAARAGCAAVQHATTADSAAVLADGGTVRTLTEQTPVGALAFAVDDRQGLLPGELLRVGAASDPNVEYVVIRDLPGRLPKGVVDPDAS